MALEGKEEPTPSLQLLPPLASGGVVSLMVCVVFLLLAFEGVKTSGVKTVVSPERTQGVPSPLAFVFSFQGGPLRPAGESLGAEFSYHPKTVHEAEAEIRTGPDKGALQLGLVLYVFLWNPLHGLKRCIYMKLRINQKKRGSSKVGPDLLVSFLDLYGTLWSFAFFAGFSLLVSSAQYFELMAC